MFYTQTGDDLKVSIAQLRIADVITNQDTQYDVTCSCLASTPAQTASAVALSP